jgi:GGDEF domain-containing protein
MLSAQEFTHDGRRIPFSACIGVALFPKQGDNASDLLSKADSALRTAKQPGSNTYRLFTEGN